MGEDAAGWWQKLKRDEGLVPFSPPSLQGLDREDPANHFLYGDDAPFCGGRNLDQCLSRDRTRLVWGVCFPVQTFAGNTRVAQAGGQVHGGAVATVLDMLLISLLQDVVRP